jgi:hypothetical protein
MKLWVQSPIPGKSRADRFLIAGYPCDIHEHLVIDESRPYDWSFAGQITHVRREECVRELRKMQNGRLIETKQFYSGLPHDEYFRLLGKSKIVPCPSGPVCSDTFRLAEALEAGCIPIADEHPGWRDNPTTGIFNMLFPDGYPFPLIKNWSDLPHVMAGLLCDYDSLRPYVVDWWLTYKRNYFSWLGIDLKALGVSL